MNLNEALEIVNEIDFASEIFEQSKKLIHRIGQEQPCFYYQLTSGIEHRIYDILAMRKDYTERLFEEEGE